MQLFRKLCISMMLVTASMASAQTLKINGTACSSGSVAFGNNEISVTATGSCISTQVVVPTLTSVSPTTAIPGTTITATGTNFAAGVTVSVGGINATGISVTSSTSLTFMVPSVTAGSQNVIVTLNGQPSNSVSLLVSAVTPTVTSVAPTSVPPGTSISVTGTNFVTGATATVGGVNAPVTSVASDGASLTMMLPALTPGSYPVVVTVGGTASAAFSSLAVTAANPVVTSFAPTSTTSGSNITITGTGLAPGATVTIGGGSATVVGTPTGTSLTATVPALASGSSYSVVATVAGVQATAPTALTITSGTPAPTISACTGTINGSMTVTGANFVTGSTTVTLNSSSAPTTVVTATSITATVPAGVIAGSAPVVVTVSGQSATSTCTISAAQSGGSITADIQGNVIPIPSKVAGVAGVLHSGPNGANGYSNRQNAWSVSPAGRCTNTTPAISTVWYHNLDYTTYLGSNQVEYFGVLANEALVYSFIAPPEGSRGSIQVNESTIASLVAGFASISAQPCDFDVTKVNGLSGCYNSRNGPFTTSYFSTTGNAGFFECKLTPGTRYYFNFRNQDASNPTADSCFTTTGSTAVPCGGLLTLK